MKKGDYVEFIDVYEPNDLVRIEPGTKATVTGTYLTSGFVDLIVKSASKYEFKKVPICYLRKYTGLVDEHKPTTYDPAYSAYDSNIISSLYSNLIIPKHEVEIATNESQINFPKFYSEPLTDSNVDYEKVTKEPVYFEFVNVGEALNKLKAYEYTSTPCKQQEEKEEFLFSTVNKGGDVRVLTFKVTSKRYINNTLVEVKTVDETGYTETHDLRVTHFYKTFEEALNAIDPPF